jgi:hypothetical protein
MSTSQYVLNLGLLALILTTNLGTRVMTLRRLAIPLIAVVLAGVYYLHGIPTNGNDTYLELVGIAAGALLGVAAGLLVRVRRDDHQVLATAGIGFTAVWVAVIGGRILFAYGANHWFPDAIGAFSARFHILGAGAWTAAFVLMALAMMVARVAVAAVQRTRALRNTPAPAPA